MSQAKAVLRQSMKNILHAMPAYIIAQKSERLIAQLVHTQEFQRSNSLCLYVSMPSEPQTLPLIQYALSDRKRVFVPQVIPKRLLTTSLASMRMCRLQNLEELDSWPENKWKIKEPPLPSDAESIVDEAVENGGVDLLIVPGLAFTYSGYRLGRGGGYYDRYLNWYRKVAVERNMKFPKLLAMAFSEQIMDNLPMEPHDNTLDRIITA